METVMRTVEFVQSSYGGGFPDDGGTFGHGESLALVSKLELIELLIRADKLIVAMMPGVRHIALQDYKELNEVPIDLLKAIRELKGDS
jgi:hypothetical protein